MKKKINGKWKIINGVMDWAGRTVREAEEARDKTLDRKFDTYDCAPYMAAGGPFIGIVWQTHNGYFSYLIRVVQTMAIGLGLKLKIGCAATLPKRSVGLARMTD